MSIVLNRTKLQETRTKLKKMEKYAKGTRAAGGRGAGNVVPHDIPCFHTEILAQPHWRRWKSFNTTFLAGMSCPTTFYGRAHGTGRKREQCRVARHSFVPHDIYHPELINSRVNALGRGDSRTRRLIDSRTKEDGDERRPDGEWTEDSIDFY